MASYTFASFICFYPPSLVPSLTPLIYIESQRFATPLTFLNSFALRSHNRNPFILHFYDQNSFHSFAHSPAFLSLFVCVFFCSLERYTHTHTSCNKEKTTTKMALRSWIKLQISRNLFALSLLDFPFSPLFLVFWPFFRIGPILYVVSNSCALSFFLFQFQSVFFFGFFRISTSCYFISLWLFGVSRTWFAIVFAVKITC